MSARMEAIAGALGDSVQAAFDRWHEWASRQRDFIINGKPGITEEEYEAARVYSPLRESGFEQVRRERPVGWVRAVPHHGRLALWLPGHTAVHPPSMIRACPVM